MAPVATMTLYDKIGGATAVETVVKELHNRIHADNDLMVFFANTDMDRQTRSQIAFITMALGGPNNYDGKPMKEAHAGRGVTERHFDKLETHLMQALLWAGVERHDADEFVSAVAPLKTQIVEV